MNFATIRLKIANYCRKLLYAVFRILYGYFSSDFFINYYTKSPGIMTNYWQASRYGLRHNS